MNLKKLNLWMICIVSLLIVNLGLVCGVFWSLSFTPGQSRSVTGLSQINLGSTVEKPIDIKGLESKPSGQALVNFYNVYGEISKGQLFTKLNIPALPLEMSGNSSMYPDDEIDNDGDGLVDEELINQVDDDGDGLIDEDVHTEREPITGYVLKGVLWNNKNSVALIEVEGMGNVEIVRLGSFIPSTATRVNKISSKGVVLSEKGKENTTLSLSITGEDWDWLKQSSWVYKIDENGNTILKEEAEVVDTYAEEEEQYPTDTGDTIKQTEESPPEEE